MSTLRIIVEKASDWSAYYPSRDVGLAMDYLKEPVGDRERVQVLNLCRSYRYQGMGYYVSLLAEARGHRVMPSVRTLNDLRRRSVYGVDLDELGQKLKRLLRDRAEDSTEFDLMVYFGQTDQAPLADLARQIFEAFPCPILRIEFERHKRWQITAVKPVTLQSLESTQEDAFAQALDQFSGKLWRRPRSPRKYRYDLAMLHDPEEKLPPSDPKALKNFVKAGKALGMDVDMITRNDYSRLAEYDALFIRETTALDHHTYRFAHRAEREDMVVMDDPTSILRCTNKIYLNDLLHARKLATPRTEIIYRDDPDSLNALGDTLGFPLVLKIPDGSFSRGVTKADSLEELRSSAAALFQQSALLLAQEYMYTEFDWRIGVLNNQALYACQYFMSRGHWQIYNHAARGKSRAGGWKTFPIREVPAEVVKLALRATAAIGNGLYGVDIKHSGDRVAIIEVNDNPSIESDVEDAYLGEDLYRRIMDEFLRRLEQRRVGWSARSTTRQR